MIVTKQILAVKILSYLQHKISLNDLVSWAEDMLIDAELIDDDNLIIRDILANIGLADVKVFGLYWDDCMDYMHKLGYELHINAGLVA